MNIYEFEVESRGGDGERTQRKSKVDKNVQTRGEERAM